LAISLFYDVTFSNLLFPTSLLSKVEQTPNIFHSWLSNVGKFGGILREVGWKDPKEDIKLHLSRKSRFEKNQEFHPVSSRRPSTCFSILVGLSEGIKAKGG
jgi:hypothetical protein